MRYRDPSLVYRERASQWHRWWAWYSVLLNDKETRVRWEWVERRRWTFEAIPYYATAWEYRLPGADNAR